MPCRIVHMSSVHEPFDTRIFHKECKTLAMAGYDVTLIIPRAEGDVVRDGVKLRAITPPRDRRERLTRTIWNVYRAAVRENAEIYHFHDPELIPVGALLKMRGKRVIYDVHEDYAVTMQDKKWLPRILQTPASLAVRICEAAAASACDRVISVTPTIAAKFPPKKTRLVQNFPWTRELRIPDSLPYEQRAAVVVYVGWLANARGIREMAKAAEIAAQEVPLKLVVAGGVRSGALAELDHGKNGEVEYVGQLNRPQVAELLARARAGLLMSHPTRNYINAQPNKLFEYMSAGLPVVASDFPLWRKIIRSSNSGLLADPLNPQAIAEALVWLLRHPAEAAEMGRNGQRAVAEKYNWEHESKSLISTYEELQPPADNPLAVAVGQKS